MLDEVKKITTYLTNYHKKQNIEKKLKTRNEMRTILASETNTRKAVEEEEEEIRATRKMESMTHSLSMNSPYGAPSSLHQSGVAKDRKMASAENLVLDLSNPDLRENALLELSKVLNHIYLFSFRI